MRINIKNFKKGLSIILAFSMLVMFIPQNIYAANNIANETDSKIIEDASQAISEIEIYLNSKGSSIVKELEDLKEENEQQLISIEPKSKISDESSSRFEIDKVDNIETQIELLDDALFELNSTQNLKIQNPESIKSNGDVDTTLRLAVYAVISYFHSKNYKLSAELLGKSLANTLEDRDYYPTNGKVVRSTPTFRQLMATGGYTNGSDTFRPGDTTAEMDSHYAINQFNYSKYGDSIMIHDRYDYDNTKNYGGIAGIAIDTMSTAETLGILTPFRTVINETK